MKQKIYYILILCALMSVSTYAQTPKLVASVSKNKLGLNQRVKIQFTINKQGADNFQAPNFKNFQIVSGPSQSISQSWVNGSASFSQSYNYIIKPLKKGEFLIPAASIKLNNKILTSKPVKVIVLDPVDIPKDPNDPNYIAQQNVHLVAEISKSSPYVGEGIYVEYRLYVSQNISVRDFSYTDSPQYNGFWNQDIKIRGLTTQNGTYNGEQYRYVVLQKALLIPTKSGKLTIDPIEMDIVIGVPTGRGDFFGNPIVKNITKSFASAKKFIRSKELPIEGKPESFNGAVGDFNFIVSSSKNILKSNETATVSVKVTGNGNLKLFELPEIKTPSELEVFTPEQKEKINVTSRGIRGSVTKNYTIVPQFKGKYKIPSTEFSYFDLKEKKYVRLTSEDIFVDVLEGKELVTDSDLASNAKKDIVVTGANFRYIQTSSAFSLANESDFYTSKFYYLILILPLLFIPIGIVIAKRNEARSNDILGNKLRKADRLAKKYLSEAKKQLGAKEAFYVALEKALHNYLKAKLRIETSDISKEKITELLKRKSVNESTIRSFIEVFNSCDMARYSPVSVVEMKDDYEKSRLVITQIDKQL
ncbi:BatD family protein [Flavobacteriaceae bacterium]|nr:BatD family protein [Flavobacteriaceae bacterium]MDB4025058.1 BatD family protein [Flavobacteriaceae bacterium]MDB4226046.1 BatD family protein [Flavobacteriaceae bacterium]MDC1342404.1 BatD family protein [Flavobacteriaceae bacterium]